MSKHNDPQWLEEQYIENALSQREIADKCGVHRSTIRRRMNKFDIEPRKSTHDKPPHHGFRVDGYERVKITEDGTQHDVLIHRLTAVAKYGFDEVCDKHVHHINGYNFDNRPENLKVVSRSEHAKEHGWIENVK